MEYKKDGKDEIKDVNMQKTVDGKRKGSGGEDEEEEEDGGKKGGGTKAGRRKFGPRTRATINTAPATVKIPSSNPLISQL